MREERRADRVPVRLMTSHAGGNYPLTLVNLSTTGMLLNSPRPLRLGDQVQVDLPQIGMTTAKVMWNDTDEYGCQFVQPIPEAVVFEAEMASKRNRHRPVERRRVPAERAEPHSEHRSLAMLVAFLTVTVAIFYAVQVVFFD